jgi:hypothetical protein
MIIDMAKGTDEIAKLQQELASLKQQLSQLSQSQKQQEPQTNVQPQQPQPYQHYYTQQINCRLGFIRFSAGCVGSSQIPNSITFIPFQAPPPVIYLTTPQWPPYQFIQNNHYGAPWQQWPPYQQPYQAQYQPYPHQRPSQQGLKYQYTPDDHNLAVQQAILNSLEDQKSQKSQTQPKLTHSHSVPNNMRQPDPKALVRSLSSQSIPQTTHKISIIQKSGSHHVL